jgi:hypothetical protein
MESVKIQSRPANIKNGLASAVRFLSQEICILVSQNNCSGVEFSRSICGKDWQCMNFIFVTFHKILLKIKISANNQNNHACEHLL